MGAPVKLAITGGTGFVGGRLLDAAVEAGHELAALARRPMRARRSVRWVHGDLQDEAALIDLVSGADAVIHVAAVINGRSAGDFDQCNVAGTARLVDAARAAGARRFVFVSSLAAREPELSLYGRSKAEAEALVAKSGLDWAIVRPPAVYGPGDKETFELFRMARLGLVPVPASGRLSLIHVDDLNRLLLALATSPAPSQVTFEPDDGLRGGWTHRQFAAELARAVGRPAFALPLPAPMLKLAAAADELVRRGNAKLTRDRAAYFSHPDWVADPAKAPPSELWQPSIATADGLAGTAAWYRGNRWL